MNSKENPATSSPREAVVNGLPETADGDGVINNALEKPVLRDDWQNLPNIDPAGDYNSLMPAPVVRVSLSSGQEVIAATAPPKASIETARQVPIINKRRVPNYIVQDVKVGHEVLVVNKTFTTITPDQPEPVFADAVNTFYKTRFMEFEIPATKDNPAEPSLKAVSTVKGSDHVPNTVSEGRVATFSMDVDETGVPSFVPSLDLRSSTLIEDAEVLADLG